jgi:hypothetical protein
MATNGVSMRPLAARGSSAATALAQCVAREARSRGAAGSFTSSVTTTATIEVRDRRMDSVHLRGGFPWIGACEGQVRTIFGGALPDADDAEYTITLNVSLEPQS